MAAVMNGLSAYGTIIPAGGTFLNFVSYAAGAVRLSSLSHQRVIYVATHDSIGLGEDGPTHQPIETLAHFRALPNMMVWRPADGNECSAAYYMALTSKGTPSILALTRQNLPQLEGSTLENGIKGGYVALENEKADITLVSTGSEVSLCLESVKTLKDQGITARVVSMPCMEVFDAQPKEYQLKVIPGGIPALSVEVMSTMGWEKYSHEQFGLNRFGASGPYKEVYKVRKSLSHISITDANKYYRSSSSPQKALPSVLSLPLTGTRTLSLSALLSTVRSSSLSKRLLS
jgi:transketolase